MARIFSVSVFPLLNRFPLAYWVIPDYEMDVLQALQNPLDVWSSWASQLRVATRIKSQSLKQRKWYHNFFLATEEKKKQKAVAIQGSTLKHVLVFYHSLVMSSRLHNIVLHSKFQFVSWEAEWHRALFQLWPWVCYKSATWYLQIHLNVPFWMPQREAILCGRRLCNLQSFCPTRRPRLCNRYRCRPPN